MNSLSLIASAIAVLSCLTSLPAAAQQERVVAPVPRSQVVNPNMSLSAPTSSPLQSQMRENYAAQLRATQRELLQQNPSGLTRDELAIGHALNGYGAPR
jgi:hypothetical protein